MTAFQQLLQDTAAARQGFIELPLIQEVLRNGASKDLYLDFLGQAFHHVKCTASLLALAAARCGVEDRLYQAALFEYIEEERGHEEWILEDIGALGGDPEVVRHRAPRFPCKVMIGHAYYVVDHVSPYALLGMIHVLEGMAMALAGRAVAALRASVVPSAGGGGFKYLTTHSDLDVKHSEMFEKLVNGMDRRHLPLVIDTTRDFYKLYGEIFRDLDAPRTNTIASRAVAPGFDPELRTT
jgi:pyrroloquinoline quinone (PQQ) biosynthesis protein C